jgi:ATP-dependent RNA helicase DeaD
VTNEFASLGLSAPLSERARELGFDLPSRIQAAAIPVLRRGSNAVVWASAGSGITATVLLALLDRLGPGGPPAEEGGPARPRALIITVTEERAAAIARTGVMLAEGSGLRVGALTPEWSAPGGEEILAVSADTVAAAVSESTLKLDGLEALVFDRADALLDVISAATLASVAAAIPATAQRIVVTGAMTRAVERLVESHARKAINIPAQPADRALAPVPAPAGSLSYLVVPVADKPGALARLLRRPREEAPTITARSAARAAEVRRDLELRGFDVSSDEPAARVASGEAARGGRIAYDVPFDAEALAALDLEHGIVMIEPAELPHLRSIAAEAGVTLNPVGGTRAVRGSVATYRESVRRAIEEQDLDAQLSLLDPLFEQYSAAEVAAALSAMLRRHPSEIESTNADAGAPPPPAFVRLFVSLGQRDNIRPGDLVGAIAGEASIAGDQVGRIDIRDTFSVVEVSAADADRVIRALNGTTLRGRSLRVDYDRRGGATARERPARTRRPPNRS